MYSMSQAVKDCLSGTVGGILQVLVGQASMNKKKVYLYLINSFYIFFIAF